MKSISATGRGKKSATDKHLRGSSMLLMGKLIAVGVNFLTQVLTVRYLTQADYGAFTFGLAAVAFFNHVSTLGLRTTVPRFIPIYHEKDELGKIPGTIAITLLTILFTSILIIGTAWFSPDTITHIMNGQNRGTDLLLILIFLVPVEAVDALLIALFASFASPKAIFFRKYILGPGLKLLVAGSMIVLQADVLFIGYGYLAAAVAGIAIYSSVLVKLLAREGIFALKTKIVLPFRELFSFSLANFITDVLVGLTPFVATLLIGQHQGAAEIALFRVILPLAHLNRIVKMSFETLYVPAAARKFANGDMQGLNDLYWRTAAWMSIISFPLFLVTFAQARFITVLSYGARYETSWFFLSIFSFAYYMQTLTGFNALTLKIIGKLKYVVTIHVLASLLAIGANWILVPLYGARGAALATVGSMVVHNILKHAGLAQAKGIHMFDRLYLEPYLYIVFCSSALFLLQLYTSVSTYILSPAICVCSVILLMRSKRKLQVSETFPELSKLPFIGKFLSS